MSIKTNFVVYAIVLVVMGFASLGTSVDAAECKTSSGSKCTVTCSTGTATAVCNSNSKNCSTSCSDSSGNMEEDVLRSLNIVTDNRASRYELERMIRSEIPLDRLRYDGGTRQFRANGGTITVDVDRPKERW